MTASDHRLLVPLDDAWAFHRGRVGRRWLAGAGAASDTVDLPHCWNEIDTFQRGVRYHRGHGAYRRALDLPGSDDADAEWWLIAGGFYGTGDVWLDGRRLARVDGQYLGFELPLPSGAASGRTLAIRLDNRWSRAVLPGLRDPDFLLYGGLAGGLWLERRNTFQLQADTLRVSGLADAAPSGWLTIEVSATNRGARARCGWIHAEVRDAGGRLVAEGDGASVSCPPGEARAVSIRLRVEGAQVWDVDAPALHALAVTLSDREGGDVDALRTRVGFRAAEFRPREGFFLNGRRLDLHGCNRHESMPGFGSALPSELQRADAVLLKKLGCNFVRLSHYPQHPAFLDACDELGLLVYAELASWKSVRTGRWLRAAERQWTAMIRRDRNRPCIALWGMGNESRSRRAYLRLRDLANQLDPGRPVTYAENHLYRARRKDTLGIPDVWGVNYETEEIDAGCAASRLQNVIISEMANYPPARRGLADEARAQVELIRGAWAKIDGRPEVAGHLLWCFSDYATERKDRFYRCCGIVDAWRQPKRAAALFQARYVAAPFARAWADWRREGPALRHVEIYSNAPRVSAWCDGQCVAEFVCREVVALDLPFSPQPLELRGHHPGGDAVEVVHPWGAPRRVVIRPPVSQISARETLAVEVVVEDAEGQRVRDFSGDVPVVVEGPARLRAFSAAGVVRVADGVGRGFVTTRGMPGVVCITARAEGCESISGRVEVQP